MNRQEQLLALLAEPRRRAVFDAVVRADRPLTRDEVASIAGIGRKLAAHHLDRLAASGVLVTTFARPPGRGGPGAGRPSKRYAAVQDEVTLTLPPRRYDIAARILARAVLADGEPRTAVASAARAEGERIANEHAALAGRKADRLTSAQEVLAELGYEPRATSGGVRLGNCPFHALLDLSVELVCGANHSFCSGILDALPGDEPVRAVLDPEPGPDCCVRLAREPD